MDRKSGDLARYEVHDNGGRPFEVLVDSAKNTVAVSKLQDQEYEAASVYIPLTSWHYRQIWIGRGTAYPHENQGEWTYGNSILFLPAEEKTLDPNVARTKLILVKANITWFQLQETDEVVTNFVSRIGNNDVPYPYIETNRNVYLTLESVYAPIDDLRQLTMEETKRDPHQTLNTDFTRTKQVTGFFLKNGQATEETHPVILDFYNIYYHNPNNKIWKKYAHNLIQQRP